ncbi:hypothetical protein BU24DRAFT_62207 [Aaosphaeria arxii CBS 175.79]|uniref:Uncharacterized protein n=1 Tax=Aaosphaeria arxii CBS 175.79 TaxID=1450172 RepID=A0A6A5XCY9_9PLEO|nr:uncharacterized protein BU24DRAFT_62207 [Aaosphaeria arxii CBS 175.79]KAF2010634.1 hypothetical protein BU24DRAFT_62207 [Aaosphaeria arxii CBS 175.79]
MASSSHRYTSVGSESDVSEELYKNEVDNQNEEHSPQSQWHRPARSKSMKVAAAAVIILSITSLLAASIQYIASQRSKLPTTSSKDADPYYNFRYTTDLASQDDYRDQHSRWKTASGEWTSCGHSPHEALERGCKFDIMSAVWIPQPCYNATFAHEIATLHHSNATTLTTSPKHGVSMSNFTWHSDESLSPESHIRLEDLEQFFIDKFDRGERLIAYSIENFHVAHCLYMFRAALMGLERVAAGERGVYVHDEAMGRPHANHCQNVLMNYEKWKSGVVALEFGMGWCKRVS